MSGRWSTTKAPRIDCVTNNKDSYSRPRATEKRERKATLEGARLIPKRIPGSLQTILGFLYVVIPDVDCCEGLFELR